MKKRFISFVVSLLVVSMLLPSIYAATPTAVPERVTPYKSIGNSSTNITAEEIAEAESMGLVIVDKITDEGVIRELVANGKERLGPDGQLPIAVIVYETKSDDAEKEEPQVTLRSRAIDIEKSNFVTARFEDVYDEYEIPGPSTDTITYEREDYVDWTCNTTGSVEVSGEVYSVAQIRAAVSHSSGHTIGQKEKKTMEYKIDIPNGKIWVVKVWTNYRMFDWVARVLKIKLTDGTSWYPNGLKITKTVYNA